MGSCFGAFGQGHLPGGGAGVLSSQLTELFSKLRRMARGEEELSAELVRDVDSDRGRDELGKALDLWEPDRFLPRPLERREVLDAFFERQNVLVTGLPGAGKTTAIYQRLVEEGTGAVVVVERGFGAYADHPGELLRSIQVEDPPGGCLVIQVFSAISCNADRRAELDHENGRCPRS